MFYFFSCLGLSLALSLFLFVALWRGIKVNRKRKNQRPISYLLPVLLTLGLVWVAATQALPRTLDSIVLFSGGLPSEEVSLSEEQIGSFRIEHQDQRYRYNRWQFEFSSGQAYRMTYTPYSRHVIDIEEISEIAAQLP